MSSILSALSRVWRVLDAPSLQKVGGLATIIWVLSIVVGVVRTMNGFDLLSGALLAVGAVGIVLQLVHRPQLPVSDATVAQEQAPGENESPPKPAPAPAPQASQRVFDEAPPELAAMSPGSLQELLAGRTDAQIDTLMKQHVGKPVRVSGEVAAVELGQIPRITLRPPDSFGLLLFFDADDYDPAPLVALNKGDQIVVSGQIYKIRETTVMVDRCELIEVRGGAAG